LIQRFGNVNNELPICSIIELNKSFQTKDSNNTSGTIVHGALKIALT